MNKRDIIQALLAELEEELRLRLAANEDASAGATHGEARAETKWDTCGLEQSYLARGHARQFEMLAKQVDELRGFSPPDLSNRPIDVGALIGAELNGCTSMFFLLRCGGGVELHVEGGEVTVITPESPVGSALFGKSEGDVFSFRAGVEGRVESVR
jgi:hypothetical protein